MALKPSEISLAISPTSRVDVIDVSGRVRKEHADFFDTYERSVFFSHHTTAGYFEQNFCERLKNDPDVLQAYVGSFKGLFPENADYRHDQMELRNELSEAQKLIEPRNADSHLVYIGSGLQSCVTYKNRPDEPVYFVDLDGVNGTERRQRKTTILGYNRESLIHEETLDVQMSAHPIDSVNLWDPKVGFLEMLQEKVSALGISKGRIDLRLPVGERHTGLTVNEYETLLMQHDLAEVLHSPIRFMMQKGRNMLRDPRAIKEKAKDYMKYDLVHFVNEFIDATGLSETVVERVIDKFVSVPASRFLRMKRGISLIVSDEHEGEHGKIITGTYQSPILVQWRKALQDVRQIDATFTRFE
jgi:thiamine phosphate synthase YjbQ (UPF0047 family)